MSVAVALQGKSGIAKVAFEELPSSVEVYLSVAFRIGKFRREMQAGLALEKLVKSACALVPDGFCAPKLFPFLDSFVLLLNSMSLLRGCGLNHSSIS